MSDLISRQDALKAICFLEAKNDKANVFSDDFDNISRTKSMIAINNLPSAQPEPQWIPVKDPAAELPKNKQLWVTHESEEYGFRWVDTVVCDMTEWSDRISNVIAYMPYKDEPEPYKGVQ